MSAKRLTVKQIFEILRVRFHWASDKETFGVDEKWASHEELIARIEAGLHQTGDCEDYAEVAVHMLRQEGYEARFVLCLAPSGGPHVVADVNGNILCNLQKEVMPRDLLGDYVFLAASGLAPGEPWHIIVN